MAFYGMTRLAGLQSSSPELYEAATIDGASTWDRFVYVTLPLLKPVIFIVTMFSVIFTFADFQMEQPRVPVLLSVADTIRLEIDFSPVPHQSVRPICVGLFRFASGRFQTITADQDDP